MNNLKWKIRFKQLIGGLKNRHNGPKGFLNRQKYKVFSQHREDGIIDYLLNSINDDIGTLVEFGFAASECNCLNLAINRGFFGLFMDASEHKCTQALTLRNFQHLLNRVQHIFTQLRSAFW